MDLWSSIINIVRGYTSLLYQSDTRELKAQRSPTSVCRPHDVL